MKRMTDQRTDEWNGNFSSEAAWEAADVSPLTYRIWSFRSAVCGFLDSDEFRGDAGKQGFKFDNRNLKELFFTNGVSQYPEEAFRPSYSATAPDFWREYLSLYALNGNPGASVKSDWGLARISPATYSENFCLYKISTSKLGSELHEISGPSFTEPRENSANLDAHITFTADSATSLEFICLMVFHDSFFYGMTDTSDRDVQKNYNH